MISKTGDMTTPRDSGTDKGFLHQLATDLLNQYSEEADKLLIILPGKRARLFFFRAWSEIAGKPVWAPEVLTMEEFVFDALKLTPADEIELSLELWEVCKETPDFELTFEQFTGWANIIMQDFNEVDLFLADPRQVFTNLLQAKELQMWVPGEQRSLSEYEQHYIEFYQRLHSWYESFRSRMLNKRVAWQGLAFRMLAENKDLLLDCCSGKSIVFAGFNALTPSEEKIIRSLQNAGSAIVRWDADSWYLDDPMQEAGHFIRRWNAENPTSDFRWRSDNLTQGNKRITVYGVAGNRAQARLAGELLSKVGEVSPDSAVVLPDESLLLPVLNSIPPNISQFNVTMGMPFRHTLALSWLQLNLQLFTRPGRKQSQWIRVVKLMPVIRHPWFRIIAESETGEFRSDTDPAGNLKKRFYPAEELADIFSEAYPGSAERIRSFFMPVESSVEFIRKMEQSIMFLLQSETIAGQPFDKGALLESLRILKLAADSLTNAQISSIDEGFSMLRFMLNRLLQGASVPFTGEPLEGIQILGLLETRNIDFNHVILLAANEGILPAGRRKPTLIPFDLRKAHGLPGVQHQDAIFAYHFYHLLQRAKKIDIIYNSDLSSDFTGEMSRFVRQIESELVKANPGIEYEHHKVSDQIKGLKGTMDITIGKSDAVFSALKHLLVHRGLSPSELSKYIRCPLMFYFSFVARISESGTIEETVDFKELGNLVHNTLQMIYDPKLAGEDSEKGRTLILDHPFFEVALTRYESQVLAEMHKILGGSSVITGKNLIIAEVAQFMVRRFLENERTLIAGNSMEVLAVEKKMWSEIPISLDDDLMAVSFKGIVDRIDSFNGLIRITDYKTGKVEEKDLNFPSMEELFESPKFEKAFQLLFYCWIFMKTEDSCNINSGIFTLKSPSDYFLSLPALRDSSPEMVKSILDDFEQGLKGLCHELLNRQIPFAQTDDQKICERCNYQSICLTDQRAL